MILTVLQKHSTPAKEIPTTEFIAAIDTAYFISVACVRIADENNKKWCFERAVTIIRSPLIDVEKNAAVWDSIMFGNVLNKLSNWLKLDGHARIQSLTEFSKGPLDSRTPRVNKSKEFSLWSHHYV